MAPKKSKNLFFIGLFVLVGITLTIATIIWLGANQFLKEQTDYVTYFDTSVEGLEQGSPVKYQGVPAGNVSKISVAEDGKLVEVTMRIDAHIRIDSNIRIQQTMSGITGAKFLQLLYPEYPDTLGEMLNLPFQPPHQYIIATPSSLEETFTAAREVVNNLKQLEINKLNHKIMNFLDTYSGFIRDSNITMIVQNLKYSSARINNILDSAENSNIIASLELSAENLIKSSDDMLEVSKNLAMQVDNMKLPEYVEKIYNRYDTTMLSADKTIQNINFKAQNFLVELTLIIDELKKTNQDLQKSLRLINDAPSQIFLSEPPPEEK